MALLFADNTTDRVAYGSAASLDNIPIGSVLLWIKPVNVANSLRYVVSKNLNGAPNGWQIYRRGVDGTNWILEAKRLTADQVVDTGSRMVAGIWQYLVFTWNFTSGGPKCYRGTLNTPAVDVTNTPIDGSGLQVDDSISVLQLGIRDSGTGAAIPASIAMVGVWNRNLTLRELRELQFRPEATAGCKLLSFPGELGTGTQHDRSRNGNNGTVTGALYARMPELDTVFMPKRRVHRFPQAIAAGTAFPDHYYRMMRAS